MVTVTMVTMQIMVAVTVVTMVDGNYRAIIIRVIMVTVPV